MNTAALFHNFGLNQTFQKQSGFPATDFLQGGSGRAQNTFASSNAVVGSYSYSSSSAVDVSISTKGMQLSYQSRSQTSFSYISSSVQTASRPAQADAIHTPAVSADNILNFIERHVQKLADEGASSDELESALQHGLQGFKKGRDEAIDILKGYGMYAGPVAEGVAKTTDLVTAGVDALRERFIPAAPNSEPSTEQTVEQAVNDVNNKSLSAAQQTPVASPVSVVPQNAVQEKASKEPAGEVQPHTRGRSQSAGIVAAYRERFAASETVDLQVKTRDGDIVTLSLEAMQAHYRQSRLGAHFAPDDRFGVTMSSSAGSFYSAGFSFTVDGDLDADELTALEDLFKQVDALASTFFSGDIKAAFEQAADLNIDFGELASMSLNMTQTQVVQAERAYRGVADLGGDQKHQHRHDNGHQQGMRTLAKHTAGLVEMLQRAEAFAQPKKLVSDLFAAAFARLDAQNEAKPGAQAVDLQSLNNRLLDAVAERYQDV